MSTSSFGRRDFLLGLGTEPGHAAGAAHVAAHAEGSKVAIPLAKLEVLKSVGGSFSSR